MKGTMVYDGTNAQEIHEWSNGMAKMMDFAFGVNGSTKQVFTELKMVVCAGPSGDIVAEIGDTIIMPLNDRSNDKYRTGLRWGVRTQEWIDKNIK
jgi:hypothetical protein